MPLISRKARKQHYDVTVYLDRLGLALSTVPNQHIELYQLLSAWNPQHNESYSWCCTGMLSKMGSNPCFHGQDSPGAHRQWLNGKSDCQKLGGRRARFFCRRAPQEIMHLFDSHYQYIQNPKSSFFQTGNLPGAHSPPPLCLDCSPAFQVSVYTTLSLRNLPCPSQLRGEPLPACSYNPCAWAVHALL